MIRLEGVGKRYDGVVALAPVDLEIPRGDWLTVIGRNGSGKTTLLRILVGLCRPTEGRILLDGRTPGPEDWRELHRRCGFMPERVAFHEALSGAATLRFFARLRGVDPAGVPAALERVGLAEAAHRKVGTYSKGMRQRLNLAQALLGDPEILVLDEPLEGFDAHGVRLFFELVGENRERTVVLSSHRLARIGPRTGRIAVLADGRLKALGTEAELLGRLDLPLRAVFRLPPGANGTVEEALHRLGSTSVDRRGDTVVATVPRAAKMRLLYALRGLEGSMLDVRIEEPTVEDILLETT